MEIVIRTSQSKDTTKVSHSNHIPFLLFVCSHLCLIFFLAVHTHVFVMEWRPETRPFFGRIESSYIVRYFPLMVVSLELEVQRLVSLQTFKCSEFTLRWSFYTSTTQKTRMLLLFVFIQMGVSLRLRWKISPFDCGTLNRSEACLRTLVGHFYTVCCISFNSNGSMIASGSEDTRVILWDSESCEEIGHLQHHRAVRSICCHTRFEIYSQEDGSETTNEEEILFSGCGDGTIWV